MSALAPIVVAGDVNLAIGYTDSATVAGDHTYDPEGVIAPGVFRYVDRSDGEPALYPVITVGFRAPTKTSRVHRVTAKVFLPTGDTVGNAWNGITPGPSIAYSCQYVLEAMLPERSSLVERQKGLAVLCSLLLPTLYASDAVPTSTTASPLVNALTTLERPY